MDAYKIRSTEICIHGKQVDCRYIVKKSGITHLNLMIYKKWVKMDELLDLPWVYESLEAHHQNLLEEENA